MSGGDSDIVPAAIRSNIQAARQEPHFALLGGDLAYDNGTNSTKFRQFLRNYSRHMVDPSGRLIPLVSCVGNHETCRSEDRTTMVAPNYLSVFDGIFSHTSYGVLDFGDYLSLVLLDSGHLAAIAGAQTTWLAGVLRDRQERAHLIAASHVPAYPSFRTFDTGRRNRECWSPLFERYNVDAVLEHHDHTFKRTHPMKDGTRDRFGVVYLGDGSWGALRALRDPERRAYLAAYGSTNHFSLHRLEGNRRFHLARTDSGRVADVCVTENKRPARRG